MANFGSRATMSHRMESGSVYFNRMMLFSAMLRLLLIVYGEWQDTHMEVRYTDIDYFVFSDAATMVVVGRSPFKRSTYRYSPLLAFLLVPNSILHRSWGKLLFSIAGMEQKCCLSLFFFFHFLFFYLIEFGIWRRIKLFEICLLQINVHKLRNA